MVTIVEDDFNGYSNGDLDTQGNWTKSALYQQVATVQASVIKEGAKAISCGTAGTSGSTSIDNDADNIVNDGTIGVYLRRNDTGTGNNTFRITENKTVKISFGLRDGTFKYYNGSGWQTFNGAAAFNADQWYFVEAQWRSSDKKACYRVDGGAWSAWDTPHSAWTNLDGVAMTWYNDSNGDIGYVDYISETAYSAPAGPSHLKTLNGRAKANIKTINGKPVANVKSWNGVT